MYRDAGQGRLRTTMRERASAAYPMTSYGTAAQQPRTRVGYAIVSTYKELNETVGFIVYGYTAEDTFCTCYALRGGLLPWLKQLQCGTTALILEIDYSDLHPVGFNVKECLGTITECKGFETNFKDEAYSDNKAYAEMCVLSESMELGLYYKIVDIEWCAQLHPDP